MKLWIARSKREVLSLFSEEPYKDMLGRWFGKEQSICSFDIPEVKFENSPQQVEIKLIKEK
jgi:hypothetical protein